MLHHTIIPCSPDTIRRETFSLTCSSGSDANELKPDTVGIRDLPATPRGRPGTRPVARRHRKRDFSATRCGACECRLPDTETRRVGDEAEGRSRIEQVSGIVTAVTTAGADSGEVAPVHLDNAEPCAGSEFPNRAWRTRHTPCLSRADCRLLMYVSRGVGRGRCGLQGARDGLRSGPARAHPVRVHDHVPHHLPGVHDRALGLYRDARRAVAAAPGGALSPPDAVLDQDLRRVVRHGRRVRHRALLPVRHQLEPLFRRRSATSSVR